MNRVLTALGIPLGATAFSLLVIFAISRVLLAVSRTTAVGVALAMALLILVIGAVLGARPAPLEE